MDTTHTHMFPSLEVGRRAVLGGLAAGAALSVAGPVRSSLAAAPKPPNLILLNGHISLLDSRSRSVQAIAIRNGRVSAVGSTKEIRRLKGAKTQVIDLEGRSALPGINDAHVHGLAAGLSLPPLSLDVGYPTRASIKDIVAAVAAATQGLAPGSWIRGSGWNTALLEETRNDPNRLPQASDLDPISADHPVVLREFSFHTVWCNSAAMRLAGITKDTPTPAGGIIDRDASGNPIGLFRENAQPLILNALPALSLSQQREGLQGAVEVLLSHGITSYTDPGLTPDEVRVYRDAADDGSLRSRVTLMLSSSRSLGVGGTGGGSVDFLDQALERYPHPREFEPQLLSLRGVKIFADGIPPNLSGWVYDPYLIGGGHGELVVEGDDHHEKVEQIKAIVRRAHRAGYQVGTHATGDRTCDVVTAAYIQAIKGGKGRKDPRHYTIHSDLVTDKALAKLAKYGLGTNMNPSIKTLIADAMVGVLGKERAERQWPTRSALRAGATLTSASDWPVTSPDWRAGVVSAVLRQDLISGNVSGREERLSLEEALRTYTTGGAYQDGAETWKGQLTPGMVADVCVLDGSLPERREEIADFASVQVAMTVFDGRVAYEKASDSDSGRSAATATGAATAAAAACAHGQTCCCTRAPELLNGKA